MGLGSGIRTKPIPDPGSKRHRILDAQNLLATYFLKNIFISKLNSRTDSPATMSSQMARLALNSSCMTLSVDWETLKVEFCCG